MVKDKFICLQKYLQYCSYSPTVSFDTVDVDMQIHQFTDSNRGLYLMVNTKKDM